MTANAILDSQRNDAIDAYNTYPLHVRPQPKDAFAEGVQRTQCVSSIPILLPG